MRARLILAVVSLTTGVAAAQQSGDGSLAAGDGKRQFTVSVVGAASGTLAYGDPIVLTVRITPIQQLVFSDVDLIPLGDLAAIYGPLRDRQGNDRATCAIEGPARVDAGATVVATCQLVAVEGRGLWRPATWLLAPGRQQVSVKIPVVGDAAEPIPYYEEVPITFRAPLAAIFQGGLAGALLLALFTAVKERANAPIVPLAVKDWESFVDATRLFVGWLLSLLPRIWRMLLQTVMGGICAVILILLAQGTEGLSPPISIKIQDFWGGVVIGLFSIPLSRWIWTQVQPTQPPAPSP
jgi:hypothetical protein